MHKNVTNLNIFHGDYFLVLISLSSFYSFAFNSHFAYCVFALMHLVNVLSINIDLLTLS